jgi:predicted enzyme related to lactoylglutathione lyase
MPKLIHFEINADDTARAVKFYKNVFDWKIEKSEMPMEYWEITAGPEDEPGINGGLQQREDPSDTISTYIAVSSVEETITKIEKNGGKILKPKSPIPGIGYYAQFNDSEGNKIGIFESDESATM